MGLITPRGYGLFLSETHFIEIINIFSMPFFFYIKIEEFDFGFKNLQLFIL